MALSIEQLGVTMPADAFWAIETVGDAYDYYLENYARQRTRVNLHATCGS
jgi:hypothetical protein